jgi:hypothetical protein
VNHIREGRLNSLEGQSKISVDPILYRPSVKIHFEEEFQVIIYSISIYFLAWSTIELTKDILVYHNRLGHCVAE